MRMLKIAAAALALAACHQPTPAEIAKTQAEQRAADQAAAAQQAADDAKAKADAQAAAARQAADARAAHEKLRAVVNDQVQRIYSAVRPCDMASEQVQASGGEQQAFYEAATAARSACRQASYDVEMLGSPKGIEGDAKGQFSDAITSISTAEGIRSDAYAALAKAADDDAMRPSQVAALKESLGEYHQALDAGWLKFGHAAAMAGLPFAELNLKPRS